METEMGKKNPLYEIQVPSTELAGDAILCGNVIRYGYFKDGIELKSGITFSNVRAKRTRSDEACTAWHIEEVYDTLVEVQESEWVDQIMADTQDRQQRFGQTWTLHHYMVYLDGSGCIEVIADSWNALTEEPGSWT
jgi:hypothetical protein